MYAIRSYYADRGRRRAEGRPGHPDARRGGGHVGPKLVEGVITSYSIHYTKLYEVQYGGQQAGFVVDGLMGKFQTVIKPLGKLFERLSGISGSTILGAGEVALILDVPALVQRAILV